MQQNFVYLKLLINSIIPAVPRPYSSQKSGQQSSLGAFRWGVHVIPGVCLRGRSGKEKLSIVDAGGLSLGLASFFLQRWSDI